MLAIVGIIFQISRSFLICIHIAHKLSACQRQRSLRKFHNNSHPETLMPVALTRNRQGSCGKLFCKWSQFAWHSGNMPHSVWHIKSDYKCATTSHGARMTTAEKRHHRQQQHRHITMSREHVVASERQTPNATCLGLWLTGHIFVNFHNLYIYSHWRRLALMLENWRRLMSMVPHNTYKQQSCMHVYTEGRLIMQISKCTLWALG